METERYNRLEGLMAAMAAGDGAAMFSLYREFWSQLASTIRREVRRLGVHDPSADDVDGMVIDACFALFDCSGAWKPDGGALPWTWAHHRLATVASQWVGQHTDLLDAVRLDGLGEAEAAPVGRVAEDDERELEVLTRLAPHHEGCALVLEALERVASPRDQAIFLELRAQAAAGDPSPARTVARRHAVSPDVVRQAACRIRRRLGVLAVADHRFAGVVDLPIVA